MKLDHQALEEKATLLAFAQILKNPETNRSKLARDITDMALENEIDLTEEMGFNQTEDNDFTLLIANPNSRAMRSALDKVAEGSKPRSMKLKILIYFARKNKSLLAVTDEIYDDLRIKQDYPEVFMLQRQFDDNGGGQFDTVNTMHGRYVLYRPYYFDYENRVMRLLLTIGSADNPFYASLRHCYDATEFDRGPEDYTFEGLTVALPERNRAIINVINPRNPEIDGNEDKEGNQVLYIDRIGNYRGKAQTMKGVCLSSIGQSAATAWPFYVRRLKDEEAFEPDVVSKDDPDINAAIAEKLSLGAVKWKEIY